MFDEVKIPPGLYTYLSYYFYRIRRPCIDGSISKIQFTVYDMVDVITRRNAMRGEIKNASPLTLSCFYMTTPINYSINNQTVVRCPSKSTSDGK